MTNLKSLEQMRRIPHNLIKQSNALKVSLLLVNNLQWTDDNGDADPARLSFDLDELFKARPHFDAEMIAFNNCTIDPAEDPIF